MYIIRTFLLSRLLASLNNKYKKNARAPRRDFIISFSPFYPLFTFISYVLMSLIPLKHTAQSSMPPAGIELPMPVSDRPQTFALGGSATGIGFLSTLQRKINRRYKFLC
jgi:hypothetical protein